MDRRIIKVTDGEGKEIYHGEDKRFYSDDYPKCKLGIPISDWLKVGSFAMAFIIVFTTMRIDIKDIKETCKKFESYIENHDAWDSSINGVPFKNGTPLNSSFKSSSNFR